MTDAHKYEKTLHPAELERRILVGLGCEWESGSMGSGRFHQKADAAASIQPPQYDAQVGVLVRE